MKVELIRCKFDDTHSYKYYPFDYCCERLKDNPCIVFTNEYLVYGTEDENGEYIPQFCSSYTETITSYEDEWEQTSNYPIAFCPHCGELIDVKVVDHVECADKYNKLEDLRKKLWNKSQETDSKKEEAALRKEVNALDNKIDSFYKLNEWNSEEYL